MNPHRPLIPLNKPPSKPSRGHTRLPLTPLQKTISNPITQPFNWQSLFSKGKAMKDHFEKQQQ